MGDRFERRFVKGNAYDAIEKQGRDLKRVQSKLVKGGSLSDISANFGEMSSGADSIGDELVVNGGFTTGDSTGWSSSTGVNSWTGEMKSLLGASMNAISDRFAVDEDAMLFMSFDGPGTGPLSSVTALVQWYDALSGGSLIYTDRVFPCGNRYYCALLHVPTGALAARWNVTGIVDSGFTKFDDFSAKPVTYATRLILEPVLTVTVDNNPRRITAGARAFPDPGVTGRPTVAQVTTGTGNLTNGVYSYCITWIDADGETLAGVISADVTVDASHKQVTVTLPAAPYGVTGMRIYRTAAGGTTYGLVATVAATATSYTDNIADASLGAAPPEENTTLTRPVLPTFVSRTLNSMRASFTVSRTAAGADQIHGEFFTQSSAANGNWFEFDAYLEQGVYNLSALGVRATGRGMLDWYVDGQLVYAGQDWRNGSTDYNYVATFALTLAEPGWHVIRGQVNGTSGANYQIGLTEIYLQRTGR